MSKLDYGSSSGTKLAKGVYAKLLTITDAIDKSNHPNYTDKPVSKFKDGKEAEMWLELKCQDENGMEWNQSFFGEWKKDVVTGAIKGWKFYGNGIQEFLLTVFGKDQLEDSISEDYSIPPVLLLGLVGKKFWKVSYVSGSKDDGKPRYKDWWKTFPETTSEEEMQNTWAKSTTSLKSYTPEVIDEYAKSNDDSSFNYGANEPSAPSIPGSEENKEYDI